LGLELSNATPSIYWIFVPLLNEAHNPTTYDSKLGKIVINRRLSSANEGCQSSRGRRPTGEYIVLKLYVSRWCQKEGRAPVRRKR
jgi:hypothetical protein